MTVITRLRADDTPTPAGTVPATTSHSTDADPTGRTRWARLEPGRLTRARAAYTTRHVLPVRQGQAGLLSGDDVAPRRGDVVLARVEEIGQHERIELPGGRRSPMRVGDEVVVAVGDRYAPDQFEARVPQRLGAWDLVAGGGVAGVVTARHQRMADPTRLQAVGLLTDAEGRRLRTGDWAPVEPRDPSPRPGVPVVAVVGTSMNAGKTAVATELVAGLHAAGLRVGAAKVTGTGAGGDPWRLADAGADVLDFTDVGYPSTYQVPHEECVRVLGGLHHALAARSDVVVVEIADGILQAETDRLLRDRRVHRVLDGLVFAAGDALGALSGAERLRALGWPVLGLSGLLTSSPLAVREASAVGSTPVWPTFDLSSPEAALALLRRARRGPVAA